MPRFNYSRRLPGISFTNTRHGLAVVTKPNPDQIIVPLLTLKKSCRLPLEEDFTDDDDTLKLLSIAAEKVVVAQAEVALRGQTQELWLNHLPTANYDGFIIVRLEVTPVTAVNFVKYYDSEGVQQTLDVSKYHTVLDSSPPLVIVRARDILNLDIVGCENKRLDQWRINFQAGMPYDAENNTGVDESGQLAICSLVAHWYRHPEAVGTVTKEVALSFNTAIDELRWRGYP